VLVATWAGLIDNVVMWKSDPIIQVPVILYCCETVHSVYFVTYPGISCSVLSDHLTDTLSLSLVPSGSVRIGLLHGFISWDLKSFPTHPMFLSFTAFIIHWHE